IADRLRASGKTSPDELLRSIEVMIRMEKYYTPEQMEYLKKRREAVGEERIHQSHADWAELIAAVRAEKEKGTDPASSEVQALAKRWSDLVNEFTGGDPGI